MGAARSHKAPARPTPAYGARGANTAAHRLAARRALPQTAAAAGAVRQRVAEGVAQPALAVGGVGDRAEVEADRTAERVLSMPAPALAPPPGPPARAETGIREVRREGQGGQPTTDEIAKVPPLSEEEQEPSVGADEDVVLHSLDADDMAEIERGEPAGGSAGAEGGGEGGGEPGGPPPEPEVQAKSEPGGIGVGAEGGAAPPDAARAIRTPGPGRPLPGALRGFMEPRFGADFSGVRLHDQAAERKVARRIGARAFTYGRNVWLGPDESASDKRLMAHELTHVVQQNPGVRRAAPAEDAPEIEARPRRVQRGWLMEKLEPYARKVPGYTLFTVILGKSPLTGERVPRTASNLIGGLLGLIPGGTDIYDKLREARALERAFAWVQERLAAFPITWARVKRAAEQAWDEFSFIDLSLEPVYRAFRPLFDDLVAYVKETALQLLEFAVKGALAVAGPLGEKVWQLIAKGRDTILLIVKNPVGFALNLLKAVKKGFEKFYANVAKHLKAGVLGWLFGALQGLNITIPERLDLKGIVSLAMQILQVTYEAFRKILVKRLNPHGEKKVGFMEKAFAVLKTLITKGFSGVWKMMVNFLSLDRIMGVVVGGIRSFVTSTIVQQAIGWAASLSNPVGGIVRIAIAIYDVITTFLERLQQFRDFVSAIFDSIANIAQGKIEQAANYVEQTMARMVPLIISFIAAVLRLNGITKSIQDIVKKLRKPVHEAMDRFVGFVVKKAKKLLAKLLSKLNRTRKLPAKTFKLGQSTHRYYAKAVGRKVELFIASNGGAPAKPTVAAAKGETANLDPATGTQAEGRAAVNALDKGVERDQANAGPIDPTDKTRNYAKPTGTLDTSMGQTAQAANADGEKLADNPDINTDAPKTLIRATEPRFDVEGMTDTYQKVKEESGKPIPNSTLTYSQYYEADHMPEKQLLFEVHGLLGRLGGGQAAGAPAAASGPPQRAAGEEETAAPPEPPEGFNKLKDMAGDENTMRAILLYRPIHRTKPNNFSESTLVTVNDAAKSDAAPADKQRRVKTAIKRQMEREAEAVRQLYTADADSEGKPRKDVFDGLNKLIQDTNRDYNLNVAEGAAGEAAPPGAAEAKHRKQLAFDGPQNFTEREGKKDKHGRIMKEGTGPFFEADHIIDKSYPLAVKGLTFSDDKLWAKLGIERLQQDPAAAPDVKAKYKRQNTLRQQLLFSSAAKVQKYTEYSGAAILIYRPLHRSVTHETASGGALNDILAAVPDSAFDNARRYVEDGSVSVAQAKQPIRQRIRSAFETQSRDHTQAVRDAYASSVIDVRLANPGNEQAAVTAMMEIVKRVHGNLTKMHSESLALLA